MIMATSKPTIVILPGGCHSPSHYQELIEQLHLANYPTRSSVLPTVNAQNPFATDPGTDVAFIREKLLLPIFEAGNDVLLVMHSYSGIPGSVAAKGWSKSERRSRGQSGGIVGLVYIASLLLHEGDTVVTKAGTEVVSITIADVRSNQVSLSDFSVHALCLQGHSFPSKRKTLLQISCWIRRVLCLDTASIGKNRDIHLQRPYCHILS